MCLNVWQNMDLNISSESTFTSNIQNGLWEDDFKPRTTYFSPQNPMKINLIFLIKICEKNAKL